MYRKAIGVGDQDEDKSMDKFAYAVILYELLEKKPMWMDLTDEEFESKVLNNSRPKVTDPIGSSKDPMMVLIREIMSTCWQKDPYYRPK